MDPVQISLRLMSGVNLDFDMSFIIQLVIVVVLMFVLKSMIFDPYLATIDERDRRTVHTRDDAGRVRLEAEALSTRYEQSLEDARSQALLVKQNLRQEGLVHKDQAIGAARRDANETIEAAQADIATEVARARGEVDAQVDTLSKLVVEKVIGRKV